jgi:arylamine N-acetyltransferase
MVTFSAEQIQAFLDRIGIPSERVELPAASGALLGDLHWAHLRAVPFENLDIVRLGREIQLDQDALYGKIVGERRGGYCFEVNGLLAVILTDLGFTARRVMVQFVEDGGELSPAFDHLALIVSIPDGEDEVRDRDGDRVAGRCGERAAGLPRPLQMVPDLEQYQPEVDTTYRLTRDDAGDRWVLHRRSVRRLGRPGTRSTRRSGG